MVFVTCTGEVVFNEELLFREKVEELSRKLEQAQLRSQELDQESGENPDAQIAHAPEEMRAQPAAEVIAVH